MRAVDSTPATAFLPASVLHEPLAEGFIDGRPHVHGDGTLVRFVDDEWVLRSEPRSVVRFSGLPLWLARPVKWYVATRWLDEGKSIGYLRGILAHARWWARALADFEGVSLADLTSDHARRVMRLLRDEVDAARTLIEDAERAAGRALTQRERRRLLRTPDARVKSSAIIGTLRGVCASAHLHGGLETSFHVDAIPGVDDDPRAPWSADESKVLSTNARAALVGCLRREILRYTRNRRWLEAYVLGGDYTHPALVPWDAGVGRVWVKGGARWVNRGRNKGRQGAPVQEKLWTLTTEYFFGLNGRAMASSEALVRARGLSAKSASGMGRGVKAHLARLGMPRADITAAMKLREQIFARYHGGFVQPDEPRRARMIALLHKSNVATPTDVRTPDQVPVGPATVAWDEPAGVPEDVVLTSGHRSSGARLLLPDCDATERNRAQDHTREHARERAPDERVDLGLVQDVLRDWAGLGASGLPMSADQLAARYGLLPESVPALVRRTLVALAGPARARRLFAIRRRIELYHRRAIKAAAALLQIAVARRVDALLALPAEPVVVTSVREGEPLAEVHFRAGKGWGDQGVVDRVPCPGVLADVALEAIKIAQDLTASLRTAASEKHRRHLFLVPTGVGSERSVTRLRPASLHSYVYDAKRDGGGLLGRYAMLLAEHGLGSFSLHHVRHTNATHAIAGGASQVTVARYLGHNFRGGNAEQAGIYYVAGGTDAVRQRIVQEVNRVGGRGHVWDALNRIELEGLSVADPRRTHPNSQRLIDELSLEEALVRIREHNIVEPMPWTLEDARRLLKTGVVIRPTNFGGCLLPAEDGPCPAGGHACYIGTTPNDPRVKQGCGCRYQVLLPSARAALEESAAEQRERLHVLPGPEHEAARRKVDVESAIIEMQAEAARALGRLGPPEEA